MQILTFISRVHWYLIIKWQKKKIITIPLSVPQTKFSLWASLSFRIPLVSWRLHFSPQCFCHTASLRPAQQPHLLPGFLHKASPWSIFIFHTRHPMWSVWCLGGCCLSTPLNVAPILFSLQSLWALEQFLWKPEICIARGTGVPRHPAKCMLEPARSRQKEHKVCYVSISVLKKVEDIFYTTSDKPGRES